jgi:hypothetical protein
MMNVLTTDEVENFTHRCLWRVVTRQLEHAEAQRSGALYDDLAAMVFAFHAFEAHLNFLGQRLAPDIWEDEQNFFRKEPYRGFEGKVRKVFDLCQLPEPDRCTKPYSMIWALKDLRDLIAHGKTEVFTETYVHGVNEPPRFPRGRFDDLVSHAKALEAKQDIHAVAPILHTAARRLSCDDQLYLRDVWFGDDPLDGPLGHATGTMTPANP